jgi:hypothetical protein
MHILAILTPLLLLPTTLAKGLITGHNYDHDMDPCIGMCTLFARGRQSLGPACEACVEPKSGVDKMCKKCAIACKNMARSAEDMKYCDNCWKKGVSSKEW